MTDMKILEEMIKVEKGKSTDIGYIKQSKSVFLQEVCKKTKKTYKVRLNGIPNNSFIFKPKLKKINTMFNCKNNECRFADYIIIANDGKKKRIIYIELKGSDNYDVQYASDQLKGAECFIEYCRAIGNTFWHKEESEFLKGYEARYVIVDQLEGRPRKKPIVLKGPNRRTPDRPIIFRCPVKLRYKKLAA